MNKLANLSSFNKRRQLQAKINPLFNPKSDKWVATTVQGDEIVVIRQSFQHGFISLGWGDIDEKIILFSKSDYEDQEQQMINVIWKKMFSLAEVMAQHLNKLEKES